MGAAGRDAGLSFAVCDMNVHAMESVELLAQPGLLRLLRPGAMMVLTVKLMRRGEGAWLAVRDKLYERLREIGFVEPESFWLLANRRYERTVVASWKGGAPG